MTLASFHFGLLNKVSMSWFDALAGFLFIICALIAFFRGFIKEFFSIIGHFLSIILSVRYGSFIAQMVSDTTASTTTNLIISIILYIVFLIIFWFINSLISAILLPIRLGFLDKLFGLCLGSVKGYVAGFLIYASLTGAYSVIANNENKDNDIKKDTFLIGQEMAENWLPNSKMIVFFSSSESFIKTFFSEKWTNEFMDIFSSSNSLSNMSKSVEYDKEKKDIKIKSRKNDNKKDNDKDNTNKEIKTEKTT